MDRDSTFDRTVAGFEASFERSPHVMARAPGRVNLIGDHTDYNQGFVLPMAIEPSIWMAAAPNESDELSVVSASLGSSRVSLTNLRRGGGFVDYLTGLFQIWGAPMSGMDVYIDSDLPAGAGLSSSAALGIATSLVLAALTGVEWDALTAARMAQRAENEWVGVATGIMDQLAIASSSEGHLSLIDCRSLEVEPIPLPTGVVVVILDTGTRRELATSEYNDRFQTCHAVSAKLGLESLRDAGLQMLKVGDLNPEEVARARHVISENRRTVDVSRALTEGDFEVAGRLMSESHRSLRDDFEVSTLELEAMVSSAEASPGCFGARLTGAGFGGCAVALVDADSADAFLDAVAMGYREKTGIETVAYVSRPARGAHLLNGFPGG